MGLGTANQSALFKSSCATLKFDFDKIGRANLIRWLQLPCAALTIEMKNSVFHVFTLSAAESKTNDNGTSKAVGMIEKPIIHFL